MVAAGWWRSSGGLIVGVLWSVLTAVPSAGQAAAEPARLSGTVQVEFTAASSLHRFAGRAPEQPVSVRRLGDGRGWAAHVAIPVAAMETGNDWRDENMRSMLHAIEHSAIRGGFDSIDVDAARPAPGEEGTLPFRLTIAGVEQPVQGRVTSWVESGAGVSFDVRFTVSLRAFRLTAPSVLGVIRVDDAVDVTAHVRLAAADGAGGGAE